MDDVMPRPRMALASLVSLAAQGDGEMRDEMITVYVFETAREREEAAGRIERADPTDVDVGTHMNRTGAPRF